MKKTSHTKSNNPAQSNSRAKPSNREKGPTNRQLRAGENIRHILVSILARGEFNDPALSDVSITIGEVRMSPDLKHATIFVSSLGHSNNKNIADALNHAGAYIRGQVARELDSKFTPTLRFIGDDSYDFALKIDGLLAQPHVVQDLEHKPFLLEDEDSDDKE